MQPNPTPSSWSGPGPSLLVVDDDEAYRALLAQVLDAELADARVRTSGDPAAALAWLRGEGRGRVDGVVSDFRMPGLTGEDLLAGLRADGVAVPFVLVSGSDPATIPDSAVERADAFVRKGAHGPDRVVEAVRTVVVGSERDAGSGGGPGVERRANRGESPACAGLVSRVNE